MLHAHLFAEGEGGFIFLRKAAEEWGGGGAEFEDLEIYDGGVSLLMHAGCDDDDDVDDDDDDGDDGCGGSGYAGLLCLTESLTVVTLQLPWLKSRPLHPHRHQHHHSSLFRLSFLLPRHFSPPPLLPYSLVS
jgi:hypothetical protein